MKNTRKSLVTSAICLLLCFSMLLGTTFAWFTDSAVSSGNVIKTGSLDAEMYWSDSLLDADSDDWKSVKNNEPIFTNDNWEPGYTEIKYVMVKNEGDLSFKWQLSIEAEDEVSDLADVIDVYYVNPVTSEITTLEGKSGAGTLAEVLAARKTTDGVLLPEGEESDEYTVGYTRLAIAFHMQESAGNTYQDTSLCEGGFSVKLIATQFSYENDSFNNNYDSNAQWPSDVVVGNSATANVTADAENKVSNAVNLVSDDGVISANIPAGVALNDGVSAVTLTVSDIEESKANITLSATEASLSIDVHINGVAADNDVVMAVAVKELLPVGLNMGNYRFYHVEKGNTVEMTLLADGATPVHNNYEYDPATGDVVLHLKSFSEVALVADGENAWNGEFAKSFAGGDGTAENPYLIANADQLAYLGDVISNDNENYGSAYYKLIANINLGGDDENADGHIFYPIGYHKVGGNIATVDVDDAPEFIYFNDNTDDSDYAANRSGASAVADNGVTEWYTYGGAFKGTFDGNGNTIKNIYQNTWQLKGNYDGNYWNAAMGIFGYVYGGTVKNLTVDNFSSDGEYTPTGVIAAYAANSTFENIAITKCNPRVYNTGNGGIVGIGGSTSDTTDKKLTFTNVTVDNSNKISALWGSWDVACGGLVGMFRGAGHVYMTNCHVAAQIDVYNDVCGNYQYYWYRYSGMMIGTNKNMITDENGYTVPETSKFHAENCTVHFGDWNDYYYCELVANSLASYTHDHQFSRLEEVKEVNGTTITYLDGKTATVPASGRYNYVVVNGEASTENATCYHFVNGEVWNHENAGTETVGGKTVLKEDKQHYYLPFNQLFTGYGWGVKHIPVYNGENYAFDGITILDREVADSVEKFKGKVTELANNKTYKLGDIFNFVDKGVSLVPGALTVGVINVDENNPVSATIVYDRENWENGTITLTGTGEITITIQDYYFCTPTTITVTVTDRQPEEKFEIVMNNGDFLHRVGNSGTVALDKLFKAKDGVTVGTLSVTVEAVNGTSASGTYSNNAIQFTGTGIVKVTITDNDYCIPTELKLEVVDAVNATSATNATSNNVVLLNNCGFSSLEVSGGYTLYGNGFTMTCGSDSAALDFGYAFVTLSNGTLDNVQIVCPNFDYAALYKTNLTSSDNRSQTTDKTRYYNAKSGVMVSGNSQILNSRISGARAAVNVTGGNCLIDNSRIELGAVASLLVGAANSLKLRNVTLVQKPAASTYDSNKKLMGFSVLYLCDSEGKATPTTLEGNFVQQAWVNADDKQYVPSAGQDIVDGVMKETMFIHNINGKDSLNLGFAYMPEDAQKTVAAPDNITDNRTDKATIPYEMKDVKIQISILSTTVYVYSYKNTNGTADSFKTESDYKPNKQSDIIAVTYSDTADGLTTGKSFGTGGWVYELNVDLDKAPGYKLDFSKLSMNVNGVTVTDFKVNGSAKPTSPVAVTAGGVTYTLTATVNGKEYTATFKVTGTETSKESPSKISGPTTAGFGVAKSYGGDWSGAADVLTGVKVKYWSVAENKYVEFDFSNFTVPGNAGKLNGTNSYWEYTHTNNDFTLKVTNTVAIHSGKSVYGMPIRGTDGKLYFTISSTNGYVGSGTTSRAVTMQYEFTDNNGGEKLTFTHTFNISYVKDDQYSYSDLSGSGKLTKLESGSSSGGSCVTPETLITLADGTQVRVDSLTGNEELLVWNMETGMLDKAPIMFLDSEPSAEYEVIKLIFSDGTAVNVIYEHGFWDYDLNRYVYLDANAAEYIGHTFAKQNGDSLEKVQLVDVVIETEQTTAWSPVTVGHLCYFVNGMLSMPGGVGGLFNIFEVDAETMTYDFEAIEKDIETYGLYTYEELNAICPLSEDMFNAAGGAYLKISIGKGNLTEEELFEMINRYSKYFN